MTTSILRRLDPATWWLAAGLLTLAAWRLVPWFIHSWATDPYFSHGWLVMLWGLGVALFRFLVLEKTVHDSTAAGKALHAWKAGVHSAQALLLPAGGLLLLAGFAMDIASLKALGWLLSCIALVRWRLGPERFRPLAVPLYFTLLSIPWPWGIVQMVALPMQEISSSLARISLDLGGLPVLQEGVLLDTGRFKLVVEEACSGLRSFVALLTVAIYLLGTGWGSRRQRWILPFVVLAIILFGNATRLISALCIGHFFDQHLAMLWVEDISPFLLILIEAALLLFWLRRPAARTVAPRFAWHDIPGLLAGSKLRLDTGRPTASHLVGTGLLLLAVLSLLIPAQQSQVSLPEWPAPPGWKDVHDEALDYSLNEIQQAMQDGAIVRLVRIRSLADPDKLVDGQLIVSTGGPGRDVDDPRFCYRSNGWRMLLERHHELPVVAGQQGPVVNEILEELPRQGITRLDWFAYRVGKRWVNSYVELRLYQMMGRALRQLDSIAVVHVSTPLARSGDRENEIRLARQRLAALWETMPLH